MISRLLKYASAALKSGILGAIYLTLLLLPVAIAFDPWGDGIGVVYVLLSVPAGGLLGVVSGIAEVLVTEQKRVPALWVWVVGGGSVTMGIVQAFTDIVAGRDHWKAEELTFLIAIFGTTGLIAVLFTCLGWVSIAQKW